MPAVLTRWVGVVAMGGLVAGLAVAGPGRGGPPDPGVVAAHLGAELGLDDATEAKIEDIVSASLAEGAPLRERGQELADELKAAEAASPRDWKRIEKLVHQIADLRADGVILRMKTAERIEAVLPADDVAAFRALRERREADARAAHEAEGL